MEGCGSSSSSSSMTTTTTTSNAGGGGGGGDKTQVIKLNGFHLHNNEFGGHGDVLQDQKKKNGVVVSNSGGGGRHNSTSNGHVVHASSSVGGTKEVHVGQEEEFWNRKGKRKQAAESFEECSFWDAFCTYMCYAFLVIVGYINDIIRPRANQEKNRQGYVSLYASFESFYTRHVYRRVRDCWNMPICSVPGKYITLMERSTPDYGWTFEMTGKKVQCINLGSYNYLGFAENHGPCAEAAINSVKKYGVGTCSTRKELGTSAYHEELDKLVARFIGAEDAITCAMGYATNVLNIPALLNKGCLVISDAKNHASIILGLRLSGATIKVFKHNNMKSLEKRIREAIISGQPRTHLPWEKIFIVVEGVYSMEGSIARLPELIELKKKYGVYLYLDEAHSVGAMGPHGKGVVDYFRCDPKDIDILMGTFTKSFGSAGGYIAGSRELISLLKQNSHAQTYGCAMTAPVAHQILTSMKIIMGEDGTNDGITRIRQLARNARYFRMKLKQAGFIVYGSDDSPVVPTALYMPTKIGYTVREMIKRGVATVGVGFPATPLVEGRTRFCISSAHTKEMLDHALEAMYEVGHNIMVRNSRLPKPEGEILYEDRNLEDDYEDLD